MFLLAKIVVSLFLIALIIILTVQLNVVGFLIGAGIAFVLNMSFSRIDKKRERERELALQKKG